VKVERPKEVVEQKIQEIEQKAKEKVQAKVQDVKKEVKEKVQDVKKEVQAKISSSSDGAALFTPCKGCHGTDASKKALGKSAVIKGWDENKIFEALNGYKNGTYGGTMKGLMVGQVKSLSEDKLKSLAKYISTL
jgi:cytochrome c553